MELLVKDTNFKSVGIVDSFKSLIWVDRFNKMGDFELYLPMHSKWLELLQKDFYLELQGDISDRSMIIEDFKISTDIEKGTHFTITGTSLEGILRRRIIWNQTMLDTKVMSGILTLFSDNIIHPTISERKINNILFVGAEDAFINDLPLKAQYTGDNLYDAVSSICQNNDIGFRMIRNKDNNFVFSLYGGTNRSYTQFANPYIVFSPEFENIINSDYSEEHSNSCNVALVAGEGEGLDRTTTVVGSESGLARRELYVDARDVSKKAEDGETEIAPDVYLAQLAERGKEHMLDHQTVKSFEGKAEVSRTFRYNKDFFLGDIVEMRNEYGIGGTARITEVTYSQNDSGIDIYPTFEMID